MAHRVTFLSGENKFFFRIRFIKKPRNQMVTGSVRFGKHKLLVT